MLKGMGGMMKKAQEMQDNMKRIQEELGNKTVTGQAGAGAVEVIMNGHYGCEKINISAEIMSEDKDMVEALIAAAVSDATQKVKELSESEMGSLTDGLNLPAGMKLPF